MKKPAIELNVMSGQRVSIAELTITDDTGEPATFVGESKKHPRDRHNHRIGEEYAISRALQLAADRISSSADFRVLCNEVLK